MVLPLGAKTRALTWGRRGEDNKHVMERKSNFVAVAARLEEETSQILRRRKDRTRDFSKSLAASLVGRRFSF